MSGSRLYKILDASLEVYTHRQPTSRVRNSPSLNVSYCGVCVQPGSAFRVDCVPCHCHFGSCCTLFHRPSRRPFPTWAMAGQIHGCLAGESQCSVSTYATIITPELTNFCSGHRSETVHELHREYGTSGQLSSFHALFLNSNTREIRPHRPQPRVRR